MKSVMSKLLIVVMIMLTLVTISCERNNTDNIETETKAPEISDKERTEIDSQAETESINDTETKPNEIDIEDNMYLPFKLLDMTFEEIQAMYGKMERLGLLYGGCPEYSVDSLPQYRIVFESINGEFPNYIVEENEKTIRVYVNDKEEVIYPGIKLGMSAEEVKNIPNLHTTVNNLNPHSDGPIFTTYFKLDKIEKGGQFGWEIPEGYVDEAIEIYEKCENENTWDEMLKNLYLKILNDERVFVSSIYLTNYSN